MKAAEHYAEAERLIREAVSWDSGERQVRTDTVVIAAAQVHATLAQVDYLREIGDQLDTLPRRAPSDGGPR